ncbi:MAG: SAF domain-containing protein, partial [Paludibacter sp.]|nr:SAF domain-containing protein [Paludibacter sp.]
MKNRTVIGIICMVLAVAMTFVIAPVVNKITSDTTTVIRVSADVKQGAQITDAQIEAVSVKTDTLPAGVLMQKSEVVGKYAAS